MVWLELSRFDVVRHGVQIVIGDAKALQHARQGIASLGREGLRPPRGKLNAGDLIVAAADADALCIALISTIVLAFAATWAARSLTCLHEVQTVAYQGGSIWRV